MRKILVSIFVISCATFILSSCSESIDKGSQDMQDLSPVNTEQENTNDDDYFIIPASPLDEFTVDLENELIIKTAKWEWNTSCLDKYGLKNRTPKPTLRGTSKYVLVDRDWGALSISYAKNNGFQDPDKIPALPEGAPKNGYYDPDTKSFNIMTDSDKEYFAKSNECLSDFVDGQSKYVGFISEEINSIYGELLIKSSDLAKSDSRVLNAISDWSKCMKNAGFNFDTPEQAKNNNWDYNNPPTETEKQTAIQDVKCKQETKLMDTWYSVLYEKQKSLITEYLPTLNELKIHYAKQVEYAQKVISEIK